MVSTGPQGPQVLLGTQSIATSPKSLAKRSTLKDKGLLVAIDTPYQIFDQQGSYIHVAAWSVDGQPARQADVFIGSNHIGKTNEYGSFVFQHPPKGSKRGEMPQGGTITVVDASNDKIQGSVPFQPNVRTASFASDHLFVYTDRGVYKPGDAVKVRVIGWHLKDDYKPLEEKDVEVLLRAPSGQTIGGAKRTTDEFGVTSMELAVPLTAKEGLYTLEVAYQQERQTARLQVRDFKPPKTVIAHDLPRFLTAGQTDLNTTITLTPSQGGDFEKGTLTLRAMSNGRQLFAREQKVSGSGPHVFELSGKTLARIKSSLTTGQWLNLELDVLDAQGSKDRVVREIRYTDNPYVAVIELDKDQYSTDDSVEVVAKLRDLDGVPIRNKSVELRAGGDTFKATSDDSGTVQFSLVMGTSNVSMSLHIEGVKRPIASSTARWSAPRAMVSHIPQPIIKERQTARVKVKFPAHIKPMEKVVHMDVVDTSGAIVNAVLLPITETTEGFVAEGEFSSPSWGSMLLTFFALGAPKKGALDNDVPHHTIGLMTEGQNLVVNPDRELTITLDGIPDEVAPGTKLDVTARVLDHEGIITPAELGFAVVDQRILSLKDPLEITPMDHFYDPTLRTMSTTGSKILSWPVVSRNWGARQRDVALPPFPFLEGGGISHLNNGHAEFADGDSSEIEEESTKGGAPPSEMSKKMPAAKAHMGGVMDSEMEPEPAEGFLRREDGARKAKKPARNTQITIRTRFEATSTWQPHMRTPGESKLSFELPDSIAEQELILVASNDRGAVGVARKTVRVTQGLFAQADFPATLYVGETMNVPVLVQNNTKSKQSIKLSFASETLEHVGRLPDMELAANSSQVVALTLRADAVGDLSYRLDVEGAGIKDRILGTAHVRPAGSSSLRATPGQINTGKTFEHTFTVPDDGSHTQAWVTLAPPTITTAMSGILEMQSTLRERPLLVASDLATAALILRYAQKHDLQSAQLDDLRARVLSAMSTLQIAQRPDGAFSYWRNAKPSPYVTAWALEGMLEAMELDIPLPGDAVQRASDYLVASHRDDQLVSTDEIAFWEGDSKTVRIGVSAEIFDVLSRVPVSMQSDAHRAFLKEQGPRFTQYLESNTLDPLTAGRVISALVRTETLPVVEARAVIDRLRSVRDNQHWEPSWFHAYGGRVEATTAMIGAMVATDPQGYAVEIRDALGWVLSTRDAWGQWHNERGTAAALRALMLVPPSKDATDGELVISIDGREVKRVELDASDPFMSAPELGHVTLSNALTPGKHTISAKYTGTMNIPLQVFEQSWKEAPGASASAQGHSLEVSAPRTLNTSQTATLAVKVSMASGHKPATLHIAPGSLLDVDLAALNTLVEETPGVVDWHMSRGEIVLDLDSSFTQADLEVPMTAIRAGEGVWPTISLQETRSNHTSLLATAGELTVK